MGKKKSTKIGNVLKREIIRAALERSQSVDMMGMMPHMEGAEDIHYDDVEEMLNLPYVNREEVPLAMDIFKPVTEEDDELPVIVTIHGGGLTIGDRTLSRPFCRLLAHRGYLVFSVEYRLAPRANVCQELGDVCVGLDYVGRKLVEFNVDFNRIFLAAESAGAYLALYVAAMKDSYGLQNAIGYAPSRMRFKALFLNSGMYYTNRNDPCGWMLSEQIYGEKQLDETFLEYMNPEHPEIIRHLPPVMMTTSRGDFLNNYSVMLCEALQKAGKTCKLLYYPERELSHAFMTMQVYHPRTLESIDKMLAFFEEQAAGKNKDPELERKRKRTRTRISNGNINKQGVWKCIRELTATEPERLSATALIDCTREYTYEQMFAEWDRYARVFSALEMTAAHNTRVGIAGTISAEPLFCFYGLNMTGAAVSMLSYPDFLPGGKWKAMLEMEKITDLVISDIMVTPALWEELCRAKEELGLRHILLIHSKLGGPCTGPAELIFNEFNHNALRQRKDAVFLNDLLVQYADAPISTAKDDGERLAIITHTSGTTRGARKPLPYTNRAMNASTTQNLHTMRNTMDENASRGQLRLAPSFDFSSFLNMSGMVNTSLATGDTVVLTFFGFLHPKFVRAIKYYKLNVIFTSGFILDHWVQTDDAETDFSSVMVFGCGGSYIPPEKLKKYNAFIRSHGGRFPLTRGYGMSETGAAQITCSADCEEDILGYPEDPETIRIQDETDGAFYRTSDGVRTGILYVASDSLCSNTLDGEVLFELTEIDGNPFVCTNDLVRVNENGSLSYAGRADRYFVNNEGRRFDPGLVEIRIAAQPGIMQCAVVPVLDKRIHDTVPVLYVVPETQDETAAEVVRQALTSAFTGEDGLSREELPTQFVIADSIPCNANGKVDIYRITRDRLMGTAYNIVPVVEDGCLTDLQTEIVEQVNSITAGILPDGMNGASAMDLYEFLNTPQNNNGINPFDPSDLKKLFGGFLPKNKDGKAFTPPNGLIQKGQDLMGILYGQKKTNHYFEM